MILNDLTLPPISCAREAVHDFRSHLIMTGRMVLRMRLDMS